MLAGFLTESKSALPKSCLIQQLSSEVTSVGYCCRSRAQSERCSAAELEPTFPAMCDSVTLEVTVLSTHLTNFSGAFF